MYTRMDLMEQELNDKGKTLENTRFGVLVEWLSWNIV